MVPDNSTGISRVPAYSGAVSLVLRISDTGLSPATAGLSRPFSYLPSSLFDGPITPRGALLPPRFGLFPVRSPLLGESFLLSFPAGTKMFQFPALAPSLREGDGIASAGLPHSDICGSMRICRSPQLFAACHVLLRLREPRHPPCALSKLRYAFTKAGSVHSRSPGSSLSRLVRCFRLIYRASLCRGARRSFLA